MKKLLHIAVLLTLTAIFSALAHGQSTGFVCRIPETRHFTNIERIPLEIRLRSRDLDVDRALLNPPKAPKFQGGDSYLEVYAAQVAGKEKKEVQLKLVRIAEGRDLDESYVRFLMEMPIDENEKRTKIAKHLDDLVREAKEKKTADPKTIQMYEQKNSREALMNTFEKMYMQNRTGTFEINCRYTANSKDHPGMLQSRPVQVTVDFKSDFLDQPSFH